MTSSISTMTSSRHYYELVILDVDLSFSDAELTSWLVEEYGGALSARRVLLFPDRSPSTLVRIRVQERGTYYDILHNGCWINGERYQVQLPDRHVPRRCYRCQRVGEHLARACTQILRCVRCAGEHGPEICTSLTEQCANCGQAHRADSRTCEYWLRQIKLYRGYRVFKPSKREPGELKPCFISLDDAKRILESLKTTEDKYKEMSDLVKMFNKDMVDIRCSLTACRRTRDQCQDICDILKLFSKDILDVKVSLASLNQIPAGSQSQQFDQSLSPRNTDYTWDDYDLSQPSLQLSNLDLDLDLTLSPIPEELSDLDLDRIGRLSPFLLTDARTPSVLSLASPTDSEPIMTSSYYRSELFVTLSSNGGAVGSSSYYSDFDVTSSHGPILTSSHYSELDVASSEASSHDGDQIMTSSYYSRLDMTSSHGGDPTMTSSHHSKLDAMSSHNCDPIMTSSRYDENDVYEGDSAPRPRDIVEDVLTTSHESVYDVHLPDTVSTVTSFQANPPSENGVSTWVSHPTSSTHNPPTESLISTWASHLNLTSFQDNPHFEDSLFARASHLTSYQNNAASESGISTWASHLTSLQDNTPSESGISTWTSYSDNLPIVTSFKDFTATPPSSSKFLPTSKNNARAGNDTDKLNTIDENLENSDDQQANRRQNEEDPVYRDFCQKLIHRTEQEFKDFEKQFNPFHGEVIFRYSGGRISRTILVISMDGTVTDVRPCKIHITVINQLKTEHVTCCTFHHLASEIRDTIDKHDFLESVKMWRLKDLTAWCKKWQPSDYKRLERKFQGEKNGKRKRRRNLEVEAKVF